MVTGGSNNHTTVVAEANAIATDFITQGVVGTITLNTGSGGTGSFCVNADASPDMGVTIKAGQAYISATPSSQDAQVLRARAAADYTAYTINANASGSTKYDWIYLSVNATKANNPAADASDVTSIVTSRSSSNSTDNGSPPTYGLLLAIVTVANGASSITNSNITDKRFNASVGAQAGSLIVTQNGTGTDATIQAAGIDSNVNLTLSPKGTGAVKGVVDHLYNPYKFSAYISGSHSLTSSWAKMTFNTELFDTSSNFDSSTNYRFTAPVAGFYQFNWTISTSQSSGTHKITSSIYKNGSVLTRGSQAWSAGSQNYSVGADLVQLAANDYVEVYGIADATLVIETTDSSNTRFSGFLVSTT